MGEIVEEIRIVGAGQAQAQMEQLANAQENVGDSAKNAGEKAKESGSSFAAMAGKFAGVATAAQAIQLAIQLATQAARALLDTLQKIVELQNKIGGEAADFSGEVKILARQLGTDEVKGGDILTQLRIAGGLDAGTARELGVAADIAFSDKGGLLAGKNFQTTRDVAAFTGASGFTAQESSDLLAFLKTAGALDSPEKTKEAIAKVSGAARASRAKSIGAFVAQLNRGATGLLQSGVSLDDVLAIGGQARQVEVNEDLAAQSLITLERVATGSEEKFTGEINRVAQTRGLDPSKLTNQQRVGITRDIFGDIRSQEEEDRIRDLLSPESGQRLIKAFRGSNVDATAGIVQAADRATAQDVDRAIERGRGELSFRQKQNTAAIELDKFTAGRDLFTLTEARRRAAAQVDIDLATGRIDAPSASRMSREALEERYVLQLFRQRRDTLHKTGENTAELDEAIEDVGIFDPKYGYTDKNLVAIARDVDRAQGAKDRRPKTTVINNTVNIGTNYGATRPEYHSAPVPDFSD